MPFPEYSHLDLTQIHQSILTFWEENSVFEASVNQRPASNPYVFFEGPPSANGKPGIHHVMARTIKDLVCRYKTMQGFRVERKSGWDTHGLPIELQVEKKLGITKEDVGKTLSMADYNQHCKEDVMQFTAIWEDLTKQMGYWVDLKEPYVTYQTPYIESVWWLLKKLFDKGLLYKGYTIQPFSPAAGTGLSSHELNQPGTYRMVKDTSAVAMFKLKAQNQWPLSQNLLEQLELPIYILAWTTTPWTLPSNTGLTVGPDIDYAVVETFNPYTYQHIVVVLAHARLGAYFVADAQNLPLESYEPGQKKIPFKVKGIIKGADLVGLRYHQLMPYATPENGDPFRIVPGDFVTTQDGTGIVHTAPSFGADDFRMAKLHNLGSLTLVNRQGRFVDTVFDFANEPVKAAYLSDEAEKLAFEEQKAGKYPNAKQYLSVDERICIMLKEQGLAFRVEKYEHSYPHCWRTDKPILYYPLDSWFIKTTAAKERLLALNATINWKPESTGTGRFGNWLENLVDWNLSRSRFWGTPLPIWSTKDGSERICIGSLQELQQKMEKAKAAGLHNPETITDLHRPFVDDVVLSAADGQPMFREPDLIDVWFDSGAMPYAQFNLKPNTIADLAGRFPADFIAEGVDQTRGWFFTLHAIATLLFDSVAFKSVISNGLVLDKFGNKMSKRLGNAIDPFETLQKYGADATRWYMVSNAAPWENLKFDPDSIVEVQRKFFGTWFNTYAFFSLYANIDNYVMDVDNQVNNSHLTELDHWVIARLNQLIGDCTDAYNALEPTKAARAIQDFVTEELSNWYVRLSRRRFWKGEMSPDKQAAYQTLYHCLLISAQLSAPIAPFFSDWLYRNLMQNTKGTPNHLYLLPSIHLSLFTLPSTKPNSALLLQKMELAQRCCSLVLSLRKKENIKVRQPLSRILIPVTDANQQAMLLSMAHIIQSEVNVKQIEFIDDTKGVVTKKIKANFKALGPKYPKHMKTIAAHLATLSQDAINLFEQTGYYELNLAPDTLRLHLEDVEITSEDIPGWLVASAGKLTVALDISITQELEQEGMARELINRIQNLRKKSNLNVTDKIHVKLQKHHSIVGAVTNFKSYICTEILAHSLELVNETDINAGQTIDFEDFKLLINIH